MRLELLIKTESDMQALAKKLAQNSANGTRIYLQGVLGAGKTVFARGYLRGLGFGGKVKSPTYTLVEGYDIHQCQLYHFDLYRLHDPRELDDIGLSDYFTHESICLVEWPERAEGYLPVPTISCTIEVPEDGVGRRLLLEAHNDQGQQILQRIVNACR